MAPRTVHIRVEGRVQGVGYRAFVERHATAAQLSGWVRNRRDGSVEAVLQGAVEAVEDMLDRCRRGPPGSRVEKLEIIAEGAGAYEGFAVRPTA